MFDIMFHVWTCFYIFAKVVHELHGLRHLDNYLDDFFLAEMSDNESSNSMFKFKPRCRGVRTGRTRSLIVFDIYLTEHGTALTTILPILFLYLNTVVVTAGTIEP